MKRDDSRRLAAPSPRGGVQHDPLGLDADTAERMLRGAIAPDDAPPGYQRVAEVVAALTATPTGVETQPSRYAFSAESPRPRSVLVATRARQEVRQRHPLRAITTMLVSGVVVFSGLAAAGALPRPAQQVTADVLHHIGISVPAPPSSTDSPTVDGSGTNTVSNATSGAPGASTFSPADRPSSTTAKTSGAAPTKPESATTPAAGPVDETKPVKEPNGPKEPKEPNGPKTPKPPKNAKDTSNSDTAGP